MPSFEKVKTAFPVTVFACHLVIEINAADKYSNHFGRHDHLAGFGFADVDS